jgi:YD repeat-containing protein
MKRSWRVAANISVAFALTGSASAAQTIVYTYDAAGRLTSATYGDSLATTFTYDPNGNILAIQTAPATTDAPETPETDLLPAGFVLREAAPNPLLEASVLRFDLPHASPALLEIYGVSGRRVRTLVNGVLPAGRYTATWDGTDDLGRRVASGFYFARFEAREFVRSKPIAVLR